MSDSRELLEDLLVECLECHENDGPEAVEAFLLGHPEQEVALRRYLRFLGDMPTQPELASIPDSAAPQLIADFRILEPIGSGAMGEVWLAEQVSLQRRCALKLVRLNTVSKNARERFRREAQVLARVESPHVVRVIASGEVDKIGYLAMELVEGRGLDEVLRAKVEPNLAELVGHARDIARALEAVHEAGLVHRDVKPSNIRINQSGQAVLIDFGLARDMSSHAPGLSASGAFVGTPYYAAPEQLTGEDKDIGPRTDVYGLGVSLYECITKRRPFEGKRPEQVFRQILTAEPEPVRSLRPSASVDLACVVMKAIEKESARRYGSARELADDLDAVLELRPISARPLSFPRRLLRWSKRHRAAAGLIVLLGMAIVLVTTTLAVEGLKRQRNRTEEASRAVARAESQLADFRVTQSSVESNLRRRNEIVRLMPYRHLEKDEIEELDRLEASLNTSKGNREELFFSMLELLRRAEELDPDVGRLDDTRARVYLEQWRLARASGDEGLAAFYRKRVLDCDPENRFSQDLDGGRKLLVVTDPTDAEVHLFRINLQSDLIEGGDFRNVAVPWTLVDKRDQPDLTSLAVQPGQLCLRVVRGHDGIPTDALVTEIEGRPVLGEQSQPWRELRTGGQMATLVMDGHTVHRRLPPDLELRPTALPLLVDQTSRLKSPQFGVTISAGSWLVLVRQDGSMSRRAIVSVGLESSSELKLTLPLDPWDRVPEGFVRLFNYHDREGRLPTWMLDHEVTCSEYLEFLNSPETRRAIAEADRPIRFPRTESNASGGGYWTCGDDGRYLLPSNWSPFMPVLGVSHEDATAYTAWRSQELQKQGYELNLRLPCQTDYLCSSPVQRFVWGDRFRPQFTKSCHARSKPQVEPILSYPIDESVGGIFDVAGSAQEWCWTWFSEDQNEKMLYGGSWAHAREERFVLDFVAGATPEHAADTFGFRVVAEARD